MRRIYFLLRNLSFLMIIGIQSFAQTITIKRQSKTQDCVTGYLLVNDSTICYTLELPWRDNINYISCVPVGTYNANIRFDKQDQWRIQLLDVQGRPGIQIHIGNFLKNTEGCILVGTSVNIDTCVVSNSVDAYSKLKDAFTLANLIDGSNLQVVIQDQN